MHFIVCSLLKTINRSHKVINVGLQRFSSVLVPHTKQGLLFRRKILLICKNQTTDTKLHTYFHLSEKKSLRFNRCEQIQLEYACWKNGLFVLLRNTREHHLRNFHEI